MTNRVNPGRRDGHGQLAPVLETQCYLKPGKRYYMPFLHLEEIKYPGLSLSDACGFLPRTDCLT